MSKAKKNMAVQTKYFRKEYNSEKGNFELIEIPLNIDNWGYVQLDATVRTAFLKFGFPYPKYAIIENFSHFMRINLFREAINNENELSDWDMRRGFVESELDIQAKINSTDIENAEDWVKIEFKIL